ncbi:MAG: S49 family peptidase, partial [Planctomycetaceae bacterium]|nr:S49 family peptidase [Planctomycetaceae bacterium]
PLSDEERKVCGTILDESLDEFVGVIDEGRASLSEDDIRRIATGQIFTSKQALQLKLIDAIGDRDAAIQSLKEQLQLSEARIIRYEQPVSFVESLLGAKFSATLTQQDPLGRLLEASIPRAMYLFGGSVGLTP